MRLAALKVGIGVPQTDFSGTIHATFRSACILAVNGTLVTLAPARAGGLPGGVTLDTPADFDFEGLAEAGAAVSARAGILRIAGSLLSVDMRPATPWRSGLAGLDLDLARTPVDHSWRTARDVLEADGRHGALMAIAGMKIGALAAATRALDASAAGAAAAGLVGLGAGGTPAGDDFLVGYLAALWSARRIRGTEFLTGLVGGVAGLLPRTSDVSRVYLGAAAAGEVSELLAVLVAAIAIGSSRAIVAEAAAAAIGVGHTSGADGTLGLLAGAEAARE